MSIIVYWITQPSGEGMFPGLSEPKSQSFTMAQMSEALTFMNEQRNAGMRHVCMSVENPNMVGSKGVDSIKDGKTPDGQDYTWSKADRAGKMKRGQEDVPARDGRNL
jgi:hypothetical protein